MIYSARYNIVNGMIGRGLMAGAAIVLLSVCVFSANLADYKQRVAKAQSVVAEILAIEPEADDAEAAERAAAAKLKGILPKNETVATAAGSVSVDNAWLHLALDEYLDRVDIDAGTSQLVHIDERLAAIGEKIDELESAKASGPTKDEEKRKLSEILKRAEYQKPEKAEESLFQKWRREFLEWLAGKFPNINFGPTSGSGLGSMSVVLQILLYVLLTAVFGYFVFRLLPLFSKRFARKKRSDADERVIFGERIGDHETAVDLFAEAERLARNGELRLAIRKGYIALLCDLADRKIIGLARHKTNRDYLRDVRGKSDLFENLKGITGSFESNWYGLHETDEQAWQDFREKYQRTVGRV